MKLQTVLLTVVENNTKRLYKFLCNYVFKHSKIICMNIRANIILLIVGITFLNSCQDKCNKSDEVNEGLIISTFDIDWNCDNTHTACIFNLKEFEDYAQSNNCGKETNPVLPNVDFSKHSILIYNIIESGCVIFNRNVTIDSTKKTVTYSIYHTKCRCGYVVMDIWTVENNMVLVPKIPEDYEVIFNYN